MRKLTMETGRVCGEETRKRVQMTDRERNALKTVIVTILLLLVASSLLFAGVGPGEITKRFVPDSDRPLKIEVRGDGAEVEIASIRRGREGRARYRFTEENFDGSLTWDAEANRLTAVVDIRNRAFDRNDEDRESALDLLLPRTAPVDLDLSIKAGAVRINGEGMRFADLDLTLWAGELDVAFPTLSADIVKRVDVDVKMGETSLRGLGNLAFEKLDVNGFAGEMTLDFTGVKRMRRAARIDLEFGSITIIVPRELGVEARISKWGFMAEVALPDGWERDGKYASSPAVLDRGVELSLDIRGGVGEISIIAR